MTMVNSDLKGLICSYRCLKTLKVLGFNNSRALNVLKKCDVYSGVDEYMVGQRWQCAR